MYHTKYNRKPTDTSWISLLLGLSLLVRSSWAQGNSSQVNNSRSSLCIDASLVQEAAKTDGITDPANPDKFAKSLTSSNNFITACAGHKLTNGQQNPDGSCNPTPMGFLPSSKNMPSVRIISPLQTAKIAANKEFDVVIAARNIELGFFTSPLNTYYVAPQQLNEKGLVKGHIHLVIQLVHGTKPLNPLQFVFFKGVSDSAVNEKVNLTVTGGLPDGTYRISTLTSAMNHQLVAVPIAKRGSVDDAAYIVVGTGVSSPDKAGGKLVPVATQSLGQGNGGTQLLSTDINDKTGNKHIKGEGTGGGSNTENPENLPKKKSITGKKKKFCKAKHRKRSAKSKRKI